MNTVIIPRPEHPQPMMRRDSWQNLNGKWLFEFDFGASGAERGFYNPKTPVSTQKESQFPSAPKASFRE